MKLNEKLELIEATQKRLEREVKALELIVEQREDINRPDWEQINAKFNTQRRKVDLIKIELRSLKRNRRVSQKGHIHSCRFSFGTSRITPIEY